MFCKNQEHLKNYSYCEDCAINGKEAKFVFFCDRCHRDIRGTHQAHKDEVKPITDQRFKQPLIQFKSIISQQLSNMKQKIDKAKQSSMDFNLILKTLKGSSMPYLKLLDDKQKFTDLIRNKQIMAWLLEMKFWQGSTEKSSFMKLQNRLKHSVEQKIISANKAMQKILKPVTQSVDLDTFKIEWDETDTDDVIRAQMQKLKQQNQLRLKEQQLYNVVIKLFSSYKIEECYEVDEQCANLIKRYPESKVLYLCRIRLNELLPGGHHQIPEILAQIVKNIDSKFDTTDIYHYYMAMAQWQMVENPLKDSKPYFFQMRNKRYYRLVDPKAYIDSLNIAIGVRQKPVYYSSIGLGYIVKEDYKEALRVFKKANQMLVKRNDPLDLNTFWAEVHQNPKYNDFQAIMESLQTRTLQFIVSVCKYFKSSQNYSELVECCEQLILRQPENTNFKIQFIKSILSYSSNLEVINYEDEEKMNEAQRMIFQLRSAQENYAGKLQKKLKRLRAKHSFNSKEFANASEGYEDIIRNVNKFTTGSDYYNCAASLFKLFIEEECSEEQDLIKSAQMIKKALDLKPNNKKYMRMKFFICVYMRNFNQADQIYERSKRENFKLIDDVEYERLVEYVKDNLEY